MRILQFTTRMRIGGISSYIATLSTGLQKRGHIVSVAAADGPATGLLEQGRIAFHPFDIDFKSELHPKLWLSVRRNLERYLRKERIDLVHAHTRVCQVIASWVCKKLGIPVVTTCHGFYPPRLGRRLFPCWGNRAIAISAQVKKHLEDVFNLPSNQVSVVLNAVDIEELRRRWGQQERTEVRSQWNLADNDFVLGVIARVERVKGHEFLLEAVRKLKDELPNLKVLVVGSGSDAERVQMLARTFCLEDRVIFAGEISDVTKAFAVIDLFISPQTWEEGFGLSIAEAMALGIPVVASKTGAVSEIIQHGETGWLVASGAVGQLAQAIRELAKDSELRMRLGKNGQRFAEQMFSQDRMVDEVERIYREVSTVRQREKSVSSNVVGACL